MVRYGVVEGAEVLELPGHPFAVAGGAADDDRGRCTTSTRCGCSRRCIPSKIIGIGKNYADHAAEMGGAGPASAR